MAAAGEPSNGNPVYFNDPESAAEMARLLAQDRLITAGMGGLFSERFDLAGIHRILDVACGPGGWALQVATSYPEIEVVGVDVSRVMIDSAAAQARLQGLDNVTFQVMDMREVIHFPGASFDLVNARFINFLPAAAWPQLMHEFGRITRPGVSSASRRASGGTIAPAPHWRP
jgi:cyclopropane fatty-acyl-phospholipid synthase-like methyltransferase